MKHAVQGLYEAGVAVAERSLEARGMVPKLHPGLFLQGQIIGNLKIKLRSRRLDNTNTKSTVDLTGSSSNNTNGGLQGNGLNASNAASSGTYIDPVDS